MSTLFRRSTAFALAAVLSLSLAVRGEDAPKPEKAEGSWVAPLLPPDTMFVVEIPDMKRLIERSKQTGMWQIYSNADVQNAFKGPLMQAKFGLAALEMQLGQRLNDMLQMFSQGELTVALLSMDKVGADGKPVPDLLVAVQAREKCNALLEEINKRVDQLQQQAGGVLDISQLPVGDVTVKSVRVPAQPLSLHYALVDNTIVATFGEGRLEKLLANRERAKAGIKPAEGAKPETISEVASFAKTVKKAGDNTDLLLYLNVAELLKNPLLNLKPENENDRLAWNALGLEGINSVSYALEVQGKSLREVAYVDAPAAMRKGVLALMDGEQLDPQALAAAPRNSVFAMAWQLTPDKIVEKLIALASFENPNAKADFDAWLGAQGNAIGVDLKKDLFAALTGQSVLSVSMQPHHPKLGVAFPQVVLSVGIKDVAALKNLLKGLRDAVKEKVEVTDTLLPDREIVTARQRFADGRNPAQISYCIDQNDLLVSLYPLALRDELNRRAQMRQPTGADARPLAGSLVDDPDFKTASGKLSGKPGAMIYADTGAIAVALYDTLIPVAQLAPRDNKVDLNALPTSDVLMQNLGGTVFGLNADADGVVAEGYSPTGVVSFMSMLVPAALQERRQQMRARAAQARDRQQETLNVVSQALQAYAKDNNGDYPAAVTDLKGKYLPETTNLNDTVYLGKQAAANRIVFHTSERQRGEIKAVLQDGSVVSIPRGQFGKALKDGFNAQQQDAVAPPKAPDGNF
ncbi:MAG TPA: hypothetical protein VEJ63_01105 [Planctomycetota bacterium]|nr:hypothetical protein [Planctomycetota bacterium]